MEEITKNDLTVEARIRYPSEVTLMASDGIIASRVDGHLFHRTDYHADGSQTEYFGIEIEESDFLKMVSDD